VTRQTVSNYENGKSRPDVDMLVQIAQVLGTDIQQLIYGPEPKRMNAEAKRLILSAVLTAAFGLVWAVFDLMPRQFFYSNYDITLSFLLLFVIQPVFFALLGWFGMQMIGMTLGKKPLQNKWLRRFGLILLAAVLIWFGLNLWFVCAETVNSWQYHHYIRGQWDESHQAWSRIPAEVPKLVKQLQYQYARNNHFGIYEYIQVNLAYSSCRMASNRLTRQQVEEIYRTKRITPAFEATKVDDIIEVMNHFICMRYVVDNIMMPLTQTFIKHLSCAQTVHGRHS